MALEVKAYPLKDFSLAGTGADPSLKYGISFTTLRYNADDGLIYCGLTSADGDIFYTFNPKTKEYTSLNFREIADQYDVKIHRSLEYDQGVYYGATAGLHPVQERLKAGGGKLFRYDPKTKKYDLLSRPVKLDYIQTITMDRKRKILYGFTYPVSKFFRYDILTDTAYDFDYVGACPHIPAVDDDGYVWGQYEGNQLFKYHPDEGFTWFNHGVPIMHLWGQAKTWSGTDGMIKMNDGYIYIGATDGALHRLDPKTAEVEYLGKPHTSCRLAYLAEGPDGLLYGGAGASYDTTIFFRYDRKARNFDVLGKIYDAELKKSCFIVHDVAMTPDFRLYAAETDNPDRAGYLWELKVK